MGHRGRHGSAGRIVPNEGFRMGITIHPGPADPTIYASTDGPSIADNMASEDVRWVRADNSRITG